MSRKRNVDGVQSGKYLVFEILDTIEIEAVIFDNALLNCSQLILTPAYVFVLNSVDMTVGFSSFEYLLN